MSTQKGTPHRRHVTTQNNTTQHIQTNTVQHTTHHTTHQCYDITAHTTQNNITRHTTTSLIPTLHNTAKVETRQHSIHPPKHIGNPARHNVSSATTVLRDAQSTSRGN
ncbi:hypothetical protein E2C01_019687 [Portunus trituberculatus]|uniref:Uncharacterized protein n=1 Tax=Portunus trituberculatus TaxID=210409 RepID=A0A5B7E149_PORTR|nr:hypothetical protein [Portunus trituberculatus]